MTIDKLVERYIEIRDKKAKLKKKHEEEMGKIDAVLEKIELALLDMFQAAGVESVRTEHGTAYKSRRTSCSIADREAYFNFVRANEAWELLEIRPSKSAVEQYLSATNQLPPGINWREEIVLNVRR